MQQIRLQIIANVDYICQELVSYLQCVRATASVCSKT